MADSRTGGWSIPLASAAIGQEEIAAVARVLESGWLTAGPETERFEEAFAAKVGARHALAVTNGTAALHLAHLVLDVGPGDEVLCPALTFVATANAARYAGARVVFCDVNGPRDLTVSPGDIARKISAKTKAIVVVHYAGFACLMDEILEIASRHRLPVIEDCAHGPLARHGGKANARFVGNLGAVGAFSFFGNKNMTTGEGGMLTTDDDQLAQRLRLLRSHGMTTLSYDRFRGHAHGYEVLELGYNYRIDDIRSAIGLVQLAKLDVANARRREVYRWYIEELAETRGVTVPFSDRELSLAAPHIMSVVLDRDSKAVRQRFRAAGIQVSKHYDLVSSFATFGGDSTPTPVAAGLELVTLPFGPWMTRDDVAVVAGTLRES